MKRKGIPAPLPAVSLVPPLPPEQPNDKTKCLWGKSNTWGLLSAVCGGLFYFFGQLCSWREEGAIEGCCLLPPEPPQCGPMSVTKRRAAPQDQVPQQRLFVTENLPFYLFFDWSAQLILTSPSQRIFAQWLLTETR